MKINARHRFPLELIKTAVMWHNIEKMTLRKVSEEINKLGVEVSHKTIYEWKNKFSDFVPKRRIKSKLHSIDTSEVKCNGKKMMMYRAIDAKKRTLSLFFCPSENFKLRKNKSFIRKYFSKFIDNNGVKYIKKINDEYFDDFL